VPHCACILPNLLPLGVRGSGSLVWCLSHLRLKCAVSGRLVEVFSHHLFLVVAQHYSVFLHLPMGFMLSWQARVLHALYAWFLLVLLVWQFSCLSHNGICDIEMGLLHAFSHVFIHWYMCLATLCFGIHAVVVSFEMVLVMVWSVPECLRSPVLPIACVCLLCCFALPWLAGLSVLTASCFAYIGALILRLGHVLPYAVAAPHSS